MPGWKPAAPGLSLWGEPLGRGTWGRCSPKPLLLWGGTGGSESAQGRSRAYLFSDLHLLPPQPLPVQPRGGRGKGDKEEGCPSHLFCR